MKFVAILFVACLVLFNLFEFSSAQEGFGGGYGGLTGGYGGQTGGYGGQSGGYGAKQEKPGIFVRIQEKWQKNKIHRKIYSIAHHPNQEAQKAYDKIKKKLFGHGGQSTTNPGYPLTGGTSFSGGSTAGGSFSGGSFSGGSSLGTGF